MRRILLAALLLLPVVTGEARARQRTHTGYDAPSARALHSILGSNPAWARAVARPYEDVIVGERFLYVATSRGLARSLDGGRTWTIHPVAPNEPAVRSVVADGSLVWAGTETGVYRSTDAGRTWARSGVGMKDDDVHLLFRVASGTLLAATRPSADGCTLYRSRSDGNLWSCVAPDAEPVDAITETANGTIEVREGDRVLGTPDEGHTWRVKTVSTSPDQAIAARFLSLGSR